MAVAVSLRLRTHARSSRWVLMCYAHNSLRLEWTLYRGIGSTLSAVATWTTSNSRHSSKHFKNWELFNVLNIEMASVADRLTTLEAPRSSLARDLENVC